MGRFVNDGVGADENALIKRIIVDGSPHLVLFARRDIYLGDEIRYDYGDVKVRQLSVKHPGKSEFRHPQTWMPPESALRQLGKLVQCQIDYLLTTFNHEANLPNFVGSGCLNLRQDGTTIFNLGPECHISNKKDLLTVPEEVIGKKLKEYAMPLKRKAGKRISEDTPQKGKSGKRQPKMSTPRISRIRASSDPGQWRYVSSEMNPADIATRSVQAATLRNTTWFRGPSFLLQEIDLTSKTDHNLVDPELDREVRPEIKTLKTTSVESKPLESVSSRFDRYSEWRKLVSAINCLRSKIKHYKSVKTLKSNTMNVVEQLLETERFIVKEVQKEGFQEDIDSLMGCNKRLPRNTEVTAIVNNRPLTCVSYDSESPSVITPSLLLTQKTADDTCPFPDFEKKDSIRHHWKYVQFLAQQFWAKWRQEYLHSLQVRPKWQTEEQNVKVGTVVLMKDNNCARNYWPTGIVERVFPSEDGKIRKVELRIIRDGQPVTYVRPISQIVLLVEPE
ncbi:unnamed protein product [Mytilus edulis]|uniref:DUF5641 domain-containing protein n=1 Tax=Mytilus edulis TaxID=6550 RepID=A0A8S3RBP4_MYTED|nr:unnamed protein product [Mytilus edulis]